MENNQYVPGVCNIGKEEIARRRNLGWFGLAAAVISVALLMWTGVNPLWRLVVFIPAAMSASGFLQAYFHFCSGFGSRGIFNFGSLGNTQNVVEKAARDLDRKKSIQISIYALIIGIMVAIVAAAI